MKSETNYWVRTVQNGLIGGGISLLLCLIGMVMAFRVTYIITGVITMAQIFVFAPLLLEGYMSVSKANTKNVPLLFAVGALAGFLGGVILAFPIILNEFIDLRSVFINFSPALVSLLTFNLPIIPGIIALLVVSTIIGIVGTGVFLLPPRIRRSVTTAVLMIVFLGLFRDMIVTVITRWGPIEYIFIWIFAQIGLSIPGAIIVFVLVGALVYWNSGREKKTNVILRTPRQKRMVRWGTIAFTSLIVLLLPWIMGPYFSEIFDNVGIYILMGLGLNIVVGFAGLLDLGYVAFYAIGAYTVGVLTTSEAVGIGHLSFWVALPIAVQWQYLLGWFSGYLSSVYVAIIWRSSLWDLVRSSVSWYSLTG